MNFRFFYFIPNYFKKFLDEKVFNSIQLITIVYGHSLDETIQ